MTGTGELFSARYLMVITIREGQARPAAAHNERGRPSGRARFYAAVNQRDWPRAWQLAGGKSRDYGTAAYRQWVGGYSCSVRDHVTRITVKGNSLLVFVRALETGGVTQDYKFSYVVRHDALTHPRVLSYTGRAPQGCGG